VFLTKSLVETWASSGTFRRLSTAVSIDLLCTLENAVGVSVVYLGYQYSSRLGSRVS